MKNILLLALSFFAVMPLTSYSGSANSGTLSLVHFFKNGKALFYTSGARSGVPSCASNFSTRFAVDGATEGGKVLLSGLLTAYSTGKKVRIFGTNNCDVYGDSESISYFYFDN